ncbi:FMN-binding protein [Ectothiorhodospira lacustris]|uniref:FMN-binding protein n=1 Tax=Ectothiorhodospira lacustris TaxID=2899127 RepID=UPI001EE842D1|nr:FMN-binding protein [Ectothiorhodospira lacustris]MCG5501156.1 FMN-binding protein [Ectothiorhodospira lacustris]MCG5509534.1 FMN-binding protein [Ectothiorhodospira lacustris]MCG5521671.1 FMN-binding protein [Ectothiorhodospira lacustris]
MSTTQTSSVARPAPTSSFRLVGTLGLIALFSGLLVVSVFEFTKPYIEENQRRALEAAVFQVVPGAVSRQDYVLTAEGLFPAAEAPAPGQRVFAAYDAEGSLRGIALQASARGYADVIRVLYGYDPSCECIIGMTVLETRETPGLGDKIETDARFVANFERLDARLNPTGTGLANAIVTVKQGHKEQPWEIDGITGATISANAIGRMLSDSADTVLPRLVPYWTVLEGGA